MRTYICLLQGDITTLKAKWKAMLTKDVSKLISEYSAIFKPLKGQGSEFSLLMIWLVFFTCTFNT